ncbi:hypothetical protein BJ165DRAFT_1612708 [Panaeolus papilionaceus]|nr:hypothetical protein BJ165DRAFT_1612708 [Panaeolus papilionaceus]
MLISPPLTPVPPLLKRMSIYDVLSACITSDDIGGYFLASGRHTFGVDYTFRHHNCSINKGWSRYIVTPSGDSDNLFQTILFGEMASNEQGTRIDAKGGGISSLSSSTVIIDDDTICRNSYVLRRPSQCTAELSQLWDAQNNEILNVSAGAEALGQARNDMQMFRPIRYDAVGRLIGIQLEGTPLYDHFPPYSDLDNPHQWSSELCLNRSWQRTHPLFGKLRTNRIWASPQELRRTYSATNLPDYGGSEFQNHSGLLLQPEIYDHDGTLIAPWDVGHILSEGSLVYAEGSFVYCSSSRDPGWLKFIAQSVSIIGPSFNS